MKPITEDQVVCLMKGIEAREKNAPKRIGDIVRRQDNSGQMTARVLRYTPSETEYRARCEAVAQPVKLDEARDARKARRAVQGFFFYSLNAGQNLA